jgi:hypothetical protein
MEVSIHNNEFNTHKVKPELPELIDALSAIDSNGNYDKLVTYALRRHGYGNDGWQVTYANDQDDLDREDHIIPEGFIELVCVGCRDESGLLIKETTYIELLAKVCEISGLVDRAELLLTFLKNPNITDDLLEADAKRCNDRWRLFVPFLEKNGWYLAGDYVKFANVVSYSIHYTDDDLNVMYRVAKKSLMKYVNARKEWVDYTKSMIKSLEDFFEYEARSPNFDP